MQKIYTVIHASDAEQIYRNVDRTIEGGADGTFLINHAGISMEKMLIVAKAVKVSAPQGFLIGLNLLGSTPLTNFSSAEKAGADALWSDEAYIRLPGDTRHIDEYDDVLESVDIERKVFKGQYFGSVAFKTQGHCSDPVAAAKKALGHMDVVVTSGVDTGHAPDPQKIIDMKAAIGDTPLAIASGMSPENIHLFSAADIIMVATGIQDSWTELNVDKIRQMVERKRK